MSGVFKGKADGRHGLPAGEEWRHPGSLQTHPRGVLSLATCCPSGGRFDCIHSSVHLVPHITAYYTLHLVCMSSHAHLYVTEFPLPLSRLHDISSSRVTPSSFVHTHPHTLPLSLLVLPLSLPSLPSPPPPPPSLFHIPSLTQTLGKELQVLSERYYRLDTTNSSDKG